MAMITAIAYQIWNSKNLLIFQNKRIPVVEAISKATTML